MKYEALRAYLEKKGLNKFDPKMKDLILELVKEVRKPLR
jgi:hypothetical protein